MMYNPLWFQYIRLYEKVDATTRLKKFDKLQFLIKDMLTNINKEFHWKVFVEMAQTFDRLGDDQKLAEYIESAVLDCPESIKWKIWLVYSRILIQ